MNVLEFMHQYPIFNIGDKVKVVCCDGEVIYGIIKKLPSFNYYNSRKVRYMDGDSDIIITDVDYNNVEDITPKHLSSVKIQGYTVERLIDGKIKGLTLNLFSKITKLSENEFDKLKKFYLVKELEKLSKEMNEID